MKLLFIDYAIKWNKPLLAICLGMQALSKVLSGDERIGYDNTIKNNTSINHLEPNKTYVHSVIINIIGEQELWVNSRHSYHVPLINNNLVNAQSSDGLIEGVELKDRKFIIGVQWHPESLIDTDEPSRKIFSKFISSSQKFH